MLVDFGADPRSMDTMSLAEFHSMIRALEARRGKTEPPPRHEREAKLAEFAEFVASDERVSIH